VVAAFPIKFGLNIFAFGFEFVKVNGTSHSLDFNFHVVVDIFFLNNRLNGTLHQLVKVLGPTPQLVGTDHPAIIYGTFVL
jgi:hypothetical protein